MTEDQVSEIVSNLPKRTCDVVPPWAKRSPDQLALVEASGSWTYSQLASVVDETRAWLQASGVRPGDRVMLVFENCRAFVAIFLALAGMDAWPALVNARLAAGEIDAIRKHSGARRVIFTAAVSPHAAEHAKRAHAEIREVGSLGPIGLGPLNENVEPEPVESNREHQVAALIYTSGTTGLPKGVMLTHRNLLFVAAISAKIRSLIPNDRVYGILPMSHAVGLSVVLLGTLISGATLYLSPRFDPITVRAAMEKDRLTVVLGVPAMFAQLLGYAKLRGLDSLKFPDLRIISSSGAPLDPAIKAAVQKLFGMPLFNGYGVTECSPNIAQVPVEEPRTDISVGRIFPESKSSLLAPTNSRCPRGKWVSYRFAVQT